jgi:hypothetical protein
MSSLPFFFLEPEMSSFALLQHFFPAFTPAFFVFAAEFGCAGGGLASFSRGAIGNDAATGV